MTRKNLAYFDGQYGHLMIVDDFMDSEITTTLAHCGRYIRIDDRKNFPQLCAGGSFSGNTLSWAGRTEDMAAHFARDCDARLYKTRKGYDKACAARRASIARYGYPDSDKPVYFG
jgi:hypothetical protein